MLRKASRTSRKTITAVAMVTLAAPASLWAAGYNVGKYIAYYDGYSSYATTVTDIANNGDLCGYGTRESPYGTNYTAFYYKHDSDDYYYVASGKAWGLNDLGQVVGQSASSSPSASGGFVWSYNAGIQYLGKSHGIHQAYDINNRGVVVGRGGSSQGLLVYKLGDSEARLQGAPSDRPYYHTLWDIYRASINDSNTVAYSSHNFLTDKPLRAFVKNTIHPGGNPTLPPSSYDTSFRDLPTPYGNENYSHPNAINDKGSTVGTVNSRPVVWYATGITHTVTQVSNFGIRVYNGELLDINNHGVSVGGGYVENRGETGLITRGFYTADLNEIIDLSSLGELAETARIINATGINDKGQIVATLRFGGDFTYTGTYLLEPKTGSSIFAPRMPDFVDATTSAHHFTDVTSGDWFDPVAAYGFKFTMDTPGSAFDQILGTPSEFGTLTVTIGDDTFTLAPGEQLDLSEAAEFTITWDPIILETLGQLEFPIQLAFTTSTASFHMTPLGYSVIPEPSCAMGLLAGLPLLTSRRRR